MTRVLIAKLLRDLRVPLIVTAILLIGFQCLWAKVTARITGELVPFFMGLAQAQKVSPMKVEETIFQGPGKIMRTLMGGENIKLDQAMDMLSIGYVHPLVQAIFCIWAVGRAAGAIAGEIDRGTMELLLAQPLARTKVVLAHLCVDLITIPFLCLSLWGGTWLGTWLVGPIHAQTSELKKLPFAVEIDPSALQVHPDAFGPALVNVGALIFAVTGYTMWISASGRFRGKVLGLAVFVTLLQFLINVVGQLWDALAVLRPFTVFYYYQPQQIALSGKWTVDPGSVWNSEHPLIALNLIVVLVAVGLFGYGMALWTFTRRDLPAPL
jgi:ABC-2 type transport system permease protein